MPIVLQYTNEQPKQCLIQLNKLLELYFILSWKVKTFLNDYNFFGEISFGNVRIKRDAV